MRRRGNISKRCMVCIMSAMMMMSSVTGTMITPMGAYAQDYATIGDMTADENGKYNLTSEDTLTLNNGTIHENNGTIKDNAEGATVEINNNIIEKNEGTVVTNAVGATVGTKNDEVSGTVVNNYGTAEESSVEKNYGTAVDSSVIENFKSGTVTGDSVVGTNHGGTVEEGINVEVNEQAVVPASQTEAAPATVQDDSPKPEENNDPPQPKVNNTNDGYVSELVNKIDNELKISGRYEKINIHFKNRDNLTVDELRTLLFYTPSNVTIHCIFFTKNAEEYDLCIYPRIPQSTIDEKGNVVLVTDWAYHNCLYELSKEDGQLAGPNRIVQIFNDFHIACRLDHSEAPDAPKPQDPPRSDVQDISIQSDQLQTAAITNAKAQTTAITNAKAQTAAITNANAAIAQANTSVKSAVTEDAAFFAAVEMQCEDCLKETNALIAEGKSDEANALIAKGLTINAGTHQGFNANTLAKLGEASRMGIATTVNFTLGSANFSVTIPGNSQIDPAALTDKNGYCNFLNLLNYFK